VQNPEKTYGALGACPALNALNARIFFLRSCKSVSANQDSWDTTKTKGAMSYMLFITSSWRALSELIKMRE
jgi:hypothetical protein